MANEIDLIVGKDAIAGLDALIAKLTIADELLVKTANDALNTSKNVGKISTPSGVSNNSKANDSTNASLQQQQAELRKTQKAIEETAKSYQLLEKQRQKAIADNAKEANTYNQIQANLNKLSVTYKDLAARKALNNDLTAKEEQRMKNMSTIITKYDNALKSVDASMGKHQRNVGNYAGGFNKMGNSINQLTREMPAFTNSAQTGFMALSNNIPIFTDAINDAIIANKQLQAQGEPTKSVLSQIAKGFFSWQTLMGVGITLMTVYGGKLVDWISNNDKLKISIDELNKSFDKQNFLTEQANANIEHNVKLRTEQLKQAGATANSINAVEEKGMKDQLANLQLVAKNRKSVYDEALEFSIKWGNSNEDVMNKYADRLRKAGVVGERFIELSNRGSATGLVTLKNAWIKAENAVKLYGQKVSEVTATNKTAEIVDSKKEKTTRENVKAVNELTSATGGLLESLQLQKSELEFLQKGVSKNNKEWKEWGLLIGAVQAKIDMLTAGENVFTKDLQGSADNVMKQITRTDIIKPDKEDVPDKWKDEFDQIVNLTQGFNDIMKDLAEQRFASQYNTLERQKEAALKFAGDSEEAKLKIQEDYENRRKQIARRQAEANKKQAIFDMTINIASSIVKTLGETGFAGIPLSLIVGALGAAQLAVAIATPLPEYYKGTDNAKSGLAWTNEKGAEIHTDKYGNIKSLGTDKGATLTKMEQGDKVYTAQESKQMLFENEYNRMLNINGIKPSSNNITADQMDEILKRNLSSRPVQITSFDRGGFNYYVRKGLASTKTYSNRAQGIGDTF